MAYSSTKYSIHVYVQQLCNERSVRKCREKQTREAKVVG